MKTHCKAEGELNLEEGEPTLADIIAAYITYFHCSAVGGGKAGSFIRHERIRHNAHEIIITNKLL
jgi:hypothetical protein